MSYTCAILVTKMKYLAVLKDFYGENLVLIYRKYHQIAEFWFSVLGKFN